MIGRMCSRLSIERLYTISALIKNYAGVLTRISGLFSRRNYNIDSIAAGVTEDPNITRITIRVYCADEMGLRQIVEQLRKQPCCIYVDALDDGMSVHRELGLIKVKAEKDNRAEIMRIAGIFRANVIDVTPESMTLEVTGDADKIEAILTLLMDFGIIEIARTGSVALQRGMHSLVDGKEEK